MIPLLSPVAISGEATGASRSRIDLNGSWERHVNGKIFDRVQVPSSLRPLGFYRLRREFLLPRLADRRAFVRFEGTTYHGRVSVNGSEIGIIGPYVPYEFEISRQAKEGANVIEVAISDLIADPSGGGKDALALGVSPGWEAYGGIIREVYVEIRPRACIENVRLVYDFTRGYTRAHCGARVFASTNAAVSTVVTVSLGKGASEVARAERRLQLTSGRSEAELVFDITTPALWSPDQPDLYSLNATLQTEHFRDTWACGTGFRDITIERNQFRLNGRKLVLAGVCRHDMWKDQGFTLTSQQMEQDMRMIKALGCNFVRLVHYPHHRRIIELADEIGLLVTEEPGYWGMNFRTMPRSLIELGYDIMERVIRRDWNSPSVFAWLLGNECTLTVDYLREGRNRCRALDPLARPVSFANSMDMNQAKPIFEQAGLDFFDAHPYVADPDDYARTVEFYGDSKPVTFTEWGWEDVGAGDIFPETHTDYLLDLVEAGKLAGHCFWSWQDIRQYSRIDWATQNGILLSGVVTESRDIRKDWYTELTDFFEGRRQEPISHDEHPRVLPLKWQPASPGAHFKTVDLQTIADSSDGSRSWHAFENAMASFWSTAPMAHDQWKRTGSKFRLWKDSELELGALPFRLPLVDGYARPLVLNSDVPEITIPIEAPSARLHILGQVTVPQGYPVTAKRNELAANYELIYASGKRTILPVRHGIEVAQSNLIHAATRIDPVAVSAQPALKFVKDVVREQYQVLLWSVPVENTDLSKLVCKLNGAQPALLIFALTVESPR